MSIITAPGIYPTIAERDYHADPCPAPSLSNSVARVLLRQSPLHAWHAHPRLNPNYQPEESKRLDLGTVAHALLVGSGSEVVEVQAPDYRTKAAQAFRDETRMQGKTPVLTKDLKDARAMADSARRQLSGIAGCEQFFVPDAGQPEVTLVWNENIKSVEPMSGEPGGIVRYAPGPTIWCRARVDWLPHNRAVFVDYKTISSSAHPDALARRIVDQDYELQAAFYERGLVALDPSLAGRIECVFVFQETDAPFVLSAIKIDAEGMDVGRRKAEAAIALWTRCLAEDRWPSYPAQITTVAYPTWALTAQADREAREHFARQDGYDPFALLRDDAAKGGLE